MHDPRDLRQLLMDEITEQIASGRELGRLPDEVASWLATAPGPSDPARFAALYDRLELTARTGDALIGEPSEIDVIERALPAVPAGPETGRIDRDALADRIHAAWLGRVAGCTMGKPVEGWPLEAVRAYLERAGGIPPTDYLPILNPWPEGAPPMRDAAGRATRGVVRGGPRDDDLDWTVLNLLSYEETGAVSARSIAERWLARLPFTATYTAERVAYANLVAGRLPPESAEWRNPYREWIGALIRADVYGWVCPGDPRRASLLALRDASISHRGNGLYAAMWTAAAIASALVGDDPRIVVAEATRHIPPDSRLATAVTAVMDAYDRGLSRHEMLEWLTTRFGSFHWVHAINNTAAICAAFLWGDRDPGSTMGLAVSVGWDTDSCAATAGSLVGAISGTAKLPSALVEPLHDRLDTALFGLSTVRISELAMRTFRLAVDGVSAEPA